MPSGDKVCNFNVAVNYVYNDRSGERRTDTTWFRVATYGRDAENCSRYLNRGSQVLVTGRVKSNAFMGNDGQPRASLEVRANNVKFMAGRDDQAGGDWGGGSGGGYGGGGSSSGGDWNSGSGGGNWQGGNQGGQGGGDWNRGSGGGNRQGGNQGGGNWGDRNSGAATGGGGASDSDLDDGQDVPF